MKIRGFAGQSGGNSSNWIPPEPPQPYDDNYYFTYRADTNNLVNRFYDAPSFSLVNPDNNRFVKSVDTDLITENQNILMANFNNVANSLSVSESNMGSQPIESGKVILKIDANGTETGYCSKGYYSKHYGTTQQFSSASNWITSFGFLYIWKGAPDDLEDTLTTLCKNATSEVRVTYTLTSKAITNNVQNMYHQALQKASGDVWGSYSTFAPTVGNSQTVTYAIPKSIMNTSRNAKIPLVIILEARGYVNCSQTIEVSIDSITSD